MVQVKFMLLTSVLLVIGFSNLSLARRPYFSDEDDALDVQEEEETSLPQLPRHIRTPKRSHTRLARPEENSDNLESGNQDEDLESERTGGSERGEGESEREVQVHEEQELSEARMKKSEKSTEPVPCTCGIFMSGQFHKASKAPPKGNAVIMSEMEETFPCTPVGNKQCTNKCLGMVIKHLPESPALICAAADRDIHKERAHLFVKNCKDEWHNSNLSAGREYCCKDNEMLKCPSS
ncbi:hypothetical protein M8J77_001820 [Diaphorina citri]|nr:hypothetical protein M8J77_001820 [Diaphorina citri]